MPPAAMSRGLAGSKGPVLNQECPAPGGDLTGATGWGSGLPIDSRGMPLGITIGFCPQSHIRYFMYRLTVVTVLARFRGAHSIRLKPNVLLAFHSMTTRSRMPR